MGAGCGPGVAPQSSTPLLASSESWNYHELQDLSVAVAKACFQNSHLNIFEFYWLGDSKNKHMKQRLEKGRDPVVKKPLCVSFLQHEKETKNKEQTQLLCETRTHALYTKRKTSRSFVMARGLPETSPSQHLAL